MFSSCEISVKSRAVTRPQTSLNVLASPLLSKQTQIGVKVRLLYGNMIPSNGQGISETTPTCAKTQAGV
jgi:hypothetical protein